MWFEQQEISPSISSWEKYVKEINKLTKNGWIFRALRKSEFDNIKNNEITIKSSFDEACDQAIKKIPENKRWQYETWMLFEFKREAYKYLNDKPKEDDFLEWLSIGRHYGMPTRLVDFTYSPYIAAYFALSTKREKENGCIIALNLEWMKRDIENNFTGRWKKKLQPIRNQYASFHNPKLFRKFAFEWKENYVAPVNPLRRNPRLAMQEGLFLCPANISKSFDENLRNTFKKAQNVKRIFILSREMRREAIIDLRKMNIDLATLYPDLIGWAESQRDLVHLEITDKRFIKELLVSIRKPYI